MKYLVALAPISNAKCSIEMNMKYIKYEYLQLVDMQIIVSYFLAYFIMNRGSEGLQPSI